jgi:Ribose/xylose/arabinose/galactoside ABC-type transport systems, permease components
VCALSIPAFATWTNLVNFLYHTTIMSMLVLAQGFVLMSGNLDLSIDAVLAFAPGVAVLMSVKWFPGCSAAPGQPLFSPCPSVPCSGFSTDSALPGSE